MPRAKAQKSKNEPEASPLIPDLSVFAESWNKAFENFKKIELSELKASELSFEMKNLLKSKAIISKRLLSFGARG